MITPPHQLLRLLRERGVHPKDVAHDLGVNPATVYAWANRYVRCPAAKAERLAARLSVEPAALGVVVKHPLQPKPPKGVTRRGPPPGTVRHPERNAEMYRLREEGLTLQEIGARYGMTREAVRLSVLTHSRTASVPPPVVPERADPRGAEAYRLRQQGMAWGAIERVLGCRRFEARSRAAAYATAHRLRMPVVDAVHPHSRPEQNRRAYEMRLTGETWPAIGKALGFAATPAQQAQGHARRHANRHNLPWPPKVTR